MNNLFVSVYLHYTLVSLVSLVVNYLDYLVAEWFELDFLN
jgi:hypothetical protein